MADSLMRKIAELDAEVEKLETEKNDLLLKQAEVNSATQALQIVKAENSKLSATIEDLRAQGATLANGQGELSAEEKQALEATITGLEAALQEWTNLAKASTKVLLS